MRKMHTLLTAAILAASLLAFPSEATSRSHTVVSGDTMWKLAVQYQVGTREIIQANPQISNPNLINWSPYLTVTYTMPSLLPLPQPQSSVQNWYDDATATNAAISPHTTPPVSDS